jgi:hypothetical protein
MVTELAYKHLGIEKVIGDTTMKDNDGERLF